jgi:hypothetical protein
MPVDRYVKTLLTIIAGCLVWLALGSAPRWPTLHAQGAQPGPPIPITTVFQGSDFGYRIDTMRPGEAPTGTLVVQINGLWYEARLDYKK